MWFPLLKLGALCSTHFVHAPVDRLIEEGVDGLSRDDAVDVAGLDSLCSSFVRDPAARLARGQGWTLTVDAFASKANSMLPRSPVTPSRALKRRTPVPSVTGIALPAAVGLMLRLTRRCHRACRLCRQFFPLPLAAEPHSLPLPAAWRPFFSAACPPTKESGSENALT